MRLRILTLLCYLTVLVLATGKLEDKSDIDDLENAVVIFTDAKKPVEVGGLFTPNATFDPGQGAPARPIQGRPAIVAEVRRLIPANVTSFSQLGTKLIKFDPPFDREGRSNRASAITYLTITFFSAGNSTGPLILLFKVVDKEIVRTNETEYGGWRIHDRELIPVVSFPSLFSTITIVLRLESTPFFLFLFPPPSPLPKKRFLQYVDPK